MQFTLRSIRGSIGYTEDEVARHCRVKKEMIVQLEINSSDISYTLLLKIINLYNVTMDLVFLGLESDCHNKRYYAVT